MAKGVSGIAFKWSFAILLVKPTETSSRCQGRRTITSEAIYAPTYSVYSLLEIYLYTESY